METSQRLLILVPHRDARLPLRAWSASLFAAGLPGAWSFPWVAPLARLKRPLSAAELKSLARALRKVGNGKWETGNGEWGMVTGEMSILGPVLNTKLPADFFTPVAEAVDCRVAPLVLGAALAQGPLPDGLPAPPQVSFRAAALTNMECRFLPVGGGFFFEWGIGPLHWLPKAATQ